MDYALNAVLMGLAIILLIHWIKKNPETYRVTRVYEDLPRNPHIPHRNMVFRHETDYVPRGKTVFKHPP